MSSRERVITQPDNSTVQPTAPERPKHGPRQMGHGPMAQNVAEKAISFGPSLRRLVGMLRPERLLFAVVVAMGIVAVLASVVGPKILGKATDVIFNGVVGRQFPAGMTKEQVIEMLRAAGQGQLADMLGGLNVVPGQGIDFDLLGRWLLLASLFLLLSIG